MKLLLLLVSLIILSSFSYEKSEADIDNIYLIFTSDSLGVYGTILNDSENKFLFPGKPYKVLKGQIILFDRNYSASTNRFCLTADVGKCNYFSKENFYHYRLTNQYVIVVK